MCSARDCSTIVVQARPGWEKQGLQTFLFGGVKHRGDRFYASACPRLPGIRLVSCEGRLLRMYATLRVRVG